MPGSGGESAESAKSADVLSAPSEPSAESADGESAKVLLIRRKNPPLGWALPGGFVDYGETVEDAVRREMREETGLELENLRQFRVYSDPKRDPRCHCVSVVFAAEGRGEPKAGDDAADVRLVSLDRIPESELVFDHAKILADFRNSGLNTKLTKSTK